MEILKNILEIIKHPIKYFFAKKELTLQEKSAKKKEKQKPYNDLLAHLNKLDELKILFDTKRCNFDKQMQEKFNKLAREFISNMNDWKTNSGGYYLMEKDIALKAYYKLENALEKTPADNGYYSKDQFIKIWNRKNKLAESLIKELK